MDGQQVALDQIGQRYRRYRLPAAGIRARSCSGFDDCGVLKQVSHDGDEQEGHSHQRQRELRRLQDEFREDLNLRRAQELNKLQARVGELIRGMGKSQKYDLIVIGDGVIYAGAKVDITDKVVELLKGEFKN